MVAGGDAPLRPASGLDEASYGVRGLFELDLGLVAAGAGGIEDAVTEVIVQQTQCDVFECAGQGRDLGEDVDAVDVFFDHAGDPAGLALDPLEPAEVAGLVLDVPVRAAVAGLVLGGVDVRGGAHERFHSVKGVSGARAGRRRSLRGAGRGVAGAGRLARRREWTGTSGSRRSTSAARIRSGPGFRLRGARPSGCSRQPTTGSASSSGRRRGRAR